MGDQLKKVRKIIAVMWRLASKKFVFTNTRAVGIILTSGSPM